MQLLGVAVVRYLLATLLFILSVCTGCFKAEEPFIPDNTPDAGIYAKAGIGLECGNESDCRVGLTCSAFGLCEPSGTQVIGQECTTSPECQSNAYCGVPSVCVLDGNVFGSTPCVVDEDCASLGSDTSCELDLNPSTPQRCLEAGSGVLGEVCVSDGDCAVGLVCSYETGLVGTCGTGGDVDIGGACSRSSDCYAGLVCSENQCELWNVALAAAAEWPGAACDIEDNLAPRSYFEVPNTDGTPRSEFYRLPFPNDIRGVSGQTAVGHPTPGRGPLPYDPVERIVTAVNQGLRGFGLTPTVFFRFSTDVDFNSIVFGSDSGANNLRYVNIDASSDNFGSNRGYVWSASTSREKYLCKHWLRIQNSASDPLEPNTTYAVILLKGISTSAESAAGGVPFASDTDLEALLGAVSPQDARLTSAWVKYAPLREYLSSEGIAPDAVLNAAVFTTGNPTEVMEKGRDVVASFPVPTVKDVVVCGEGVVSPCADPEVPGRGCGTPSGAFTEIHGTIELPMFQQGIPPYLNPEDGGEFVFKENGVPQVLRTEEVCFSMTVPKSTAPATGWPVVLYAHGTGGSFRSHAVNGAAATLSTLPGGGAVVLGIDGVMHGPRRGDSKLGPEVLYFNFANPVAARGNAWQGGLDYYSLARLVETGQLPVTDGASIPLDKDKVGFWGHSQGASIGPLFLPFEPVVDAVVLSGAGAGVVQSLLRKRSPVDIPRGVFAVVREEADEGHPILHLLQQYFAPVDPLSYGRALGREPQEGLSPTHHILVVYGQGDTYTPAFTTRILGDVLDIPVISPALDTGLGGAFEGYLENDRIVKGPLSGNKVFADIPVTMGMVHHTPVEYDGHFVAFQNPEAIADIAGFFDSFFQQGTAEIQ